MKYQEEKLYGFFLFLFQILFLLFRKAFITIINLMRIADYLIIIEFIANIILSFFNFIHFVN